uniref:Uncharacterized protein LOC101514004 n=1 Tax=Cicer arietinum TaxID=3827 RepID=A0A3Q7XIR2_CICAR|nr:uncharacterized protein LOC101514004 [Cicer arietinum]
MSGSEPNPFSPRTVFLMDHLTKVLNTQMNALREEFVTQRDRISPHGRSSQNEDEDCHGNERRNQRHDDTYVGGKIKFPSFHGKSDPEAYLDWELKIDQLFEAHDIREDMRVKLVTLEFKDHALLWWDQNVKERKRCGARQLDDWDELKALLRKRYVPSHYQRELHQKLQRLKQGSKSVEDYYKDFETLIIRSNIREDDDAIIARFLDGLSYEIRDVELVHKSSTIEQQLKRKSTYKKYSSNKDSSHWNKHKRDGDSPLASAKEGKSSKPKAQIPSSSSHSSIKCFKCLGRGHIASNCPNKKSMIAKAKEVYESDSSFYSYSSQSSPSELGSDYQLAPVEGDLLMVRRLLGVQVKDDDSQKENIFHTRCLLDGKVCSLVVDSGSCTNVASTRLVTKLGLKTIKHPRPYKLQWLKDDVDILVDKQVLFDDVFPKELPHGLPPLRGIEHHIDLIPSASLPNRPPYRSNPEQTKEIERQVHKILENGWVQESLSPCAMPVILVPKKDGTWRMCTDCRVFSKIAWCMCIFQN